MLSLNFFESSEGARCFVEARIGAHEKKDFFDFCEGYPLLESHAYVRPKWATGPSFVRIHDVDGDCDQRLRALVDQGQSPSLARNTSAEIAKLLIDRL